MCSVDGCGDAGRTKRGWCLFHYDRWRRFGDPLAGGERRAAPNSLGVCNVGACGKKAVGKGLCANHLRRLHAYGDPQGGHFEQTGRSKEWQVNPDGYVYRFDPTSPGAGSIGIVYQHREVMAQILGRPLLRGETVHHKNGNRADNRPQNLELWVKSQPAGQRVEDLLAWAQEIISRYGANAA